MLKRTGTIKQSVKMAQSRMSGFDNFANEFSFYAPFYNEYGGEVGQSHHTYDKQLYSYTEARKRYNLKLVEIAIHYAYTGFNTETLANYVDHDTVGSCTRAEVGGMVSAYESRERTLRAFR